MSQFVHVHRQAAHIRLQLVQFCKRSSKLGLVCCPLLMSPVNNLSPLHVAETIFIALRFLELSTAGALHIQGSNTRVLLLYFVLVYSFASEMCVVVSQSKIGPLHTN